MSADHNAGDLADAIRPLSGTGWWRTGSGAGVPVVKVTDGPGGARGELFAGGPPSVCFPCGAALGATWDVALVERVGAALAAEVKAKGAHVLLAPTVNLQRTPLGGRHFECFSEDPVLTGLSAAAYIRGLQAAGVGACVKHLVANDAEHDRFEISSDIDERTLREVYLLPFEHALRGAGSWTAMAAYNRLNGERCTEGAWLLTTVLRDEWGWDGVVVSDWFATRSAGASANGGLDVEMPGPPLHFGQALLDAVDAGEVATATITAKVERMRLLAERTEAAVRPAADDGAGGGEASVQVALDAARGSIVLLRNEPVHGDPVLPFDRGAVDGFIAVIGPNADREVIQGGGSARVTPTEVVTVLDGMVDVFGADRVRFAEGCRNDRGTPAIDGRRITRTDGSAGAEIEVRDSAGEVRLRLAPRELRTVFLAEPWPGAGADWSMKARCTYLPRFSGEHRFSVRTNLDATISVAGEAGERRVLEAGVPVAIEVDAVPAAATAFRAALEVRCEPPVGDGSFHDAVALASSAAAAVVVIGLDNEWETEGRDRDDLALPGRQLELVRAIAAAQPRTVVLVIAGAPVDLSWADEAPGLLWGWYPGQCGGQALAEVVAGLIDPGGRLPCTMPKRLEDTPAHLDVPPSPGHIAYGERVHVGHRWFDARDIEPAFAFGFGLSYTTFAIDAPSVDRSTIDPVDGAVTVLVRVTNTGTRAGTEVVQLYLGGRPGPARHPLRSLCSFAKVTLAPGESAQVAMDLVMRDLAWWDTAASTWRADAGSYELVAARSSRDVAGTAVVELPEMWTAPATFWR